MNDEKDIESFIKSSLNTNNDDDFDFSSWDQLKEAISREDNLAGAIKTAYSTDAEVPPEEIWGNINDKLDIDTVWNRIAAKRKKRVLLPYLFLGAVGVFAAIWSLYTFQETNNKPESTFAKVKTEKKNNATQKDLLDISTTKDTTATRYKSLLVGQKAPNDNTSSYGSVKNKNQQNMGITNHNYPSIANKIKIGPYPQPELCAALQEPYLLNPKTVQQASTKKNTIGVFSHLGFAWVNNAEFREGQRKGSLVENDASHILNYGIFLERKLFRGYYLTANYFLQSEINYKQHKFAKGNWFEKQTKYNFNRYAIGIGKNFKIQNTHFIGISSAYTIAVLHKQNTAIEGNRAITTRNRSYYSGLQNELFFKKYFNKLNIQAGIIYTSDFQTNTQSIKAPKKPHYFGVSLKLGYNF